VLQPTPDEANPSGTSAPPNLVSLVGGRVLSHLTQLATPSRLGRMTRRLAQDVPAICKVRTGGGEMVSRIERRRLDQGGAMDSCPEK
jgi:hypothetical protein